MAQAAALRAGGAVEESHENNNDNNNAFRAPCRPCARACPGARHAAGAGRLGRRAESAVHHDRWRPHPLLRSRQGRRRRAADPRRASRRHVERQHLDADHRRPRRALPRAGAGSPRPRHERESLRHLHRNRRAGAPLRVPEGERRHAAARDRPVDRRLARGAARAREAGDGALADHRRQRDAVAAGRQPGGAARQDRSRAGRRRAARRHHRGRLPPQHGGAVEKSRSTSPTSSSPPPASWRGRAPAWRPTRR